MDTQDIKHLMFDLKALDNTLREAKKTAQRSLDVWDDEESLRKKISYLEDLLSDVSDDLDRARDDLNKVMDHLDGQVYKIEMAELSKHVWSK
jgi:hypothetical protein